MFEANVVRDLLQLSKLSGVSIVDLGVSMIDLKKIVCYGTDMSELESAAEALLLESRENIRSHFDILLNRVRLRGEWVESLDIEPLSRAAKTVAYHHVYSSIFEGDAKKNFYENMLLIIREYQRRKPNEGGLYTAFRVTRNSLLRESVEAKLAELANYKKIGYQQTILTLNELFGSSPKGGPILNTWFDCTEVYSFIDDALFYLFRNRANINCAVYNSLLLRSFASATMKNAYNKRFEKSFSKQV